MNTDSKGLNKENTEGKLYSTFQNQLFSPLSQVLAVILIVLSIFFLSGLTIFLVIVIAILLIIFGYAMTNPRLNKISANKGVFSKANLEANEMFLTIAKGQAGRVKNETQKYFIQLIASVFILTSQRLIVQSASTAKMSAGDALLYPYSTIWKNDYKNTSKTEKIEEKTGLLNYIINPKIIGEEWRDYPLKTILEIGKIEKFQDYGSGLKTSLWVKVLQKGEPVFLRLYFDDEKQSEDFVQKLSTRTKV
ncbi:hypothetical protein HY994_02400 [Candidatus Micrarchaeota archaeon]|nr:hypothetical protein [Candidatus Micrarchaeota archaeon]